MRKPNLALVNVVRSILYGVCLLLVACGVLSIIQFQKLDRATNGMLICFILCIIAFLIAFFAKDKKRYTTIEDLDKAYTDVKNTDRTKILFSLALLLLFAYIACMLNFYNASGYDTKYPNAKLYFQNGLSVSDNTMAVVDSMPSWFTEQLYVKAQSVYVISQLVKSGVDMESQDVTDILDDMDANLTRDKTLCVLSLFATLLFGWVYNYSKRTSIYIEQRKRLVKNDRIRITN